MRKKIKRMKEKTKLEQQNEVHIVNAERKSKKIRSFVEIWAERQDGQTRKQNNKSE